MIKSTVTESTFRVFVLPHHLNGTLRREDYHLAVPLLWCQSICRTPCTAVTADDLYRLPSLMKRLLSSSHPSSAAVSPERRASPASAQLPLPQPAQTAALPAAAHQPAHAGVPERGPAHPAAPPTSPQGPACPRVPLAPPGAAFPQSATAAAIIQAGPGWFEGIIHYFAVGAELSYGL